MVRVSFFMEQHVGHRTFYQNLREHIGQDTRIEAKWVEITYKDPNSNWERVPIISENFRGSLVGRQQVRHGLAKDGSDIAFFSTQVPAVLGGHILSHFRYVLCTDITPVQYDGMSEYYKHEVDRNRIWGAFKHFRNTQVFNKAARILPWSTWVKQSLVDDYAVSPANITVVPVGVDVNLWKAKSIQSESCPVRFLFVGGDFLRKGGDLLLEAFRQLPVGEAELILVTRETVPEEENVRVYNDLQPNSPELVALFQESDVFVLPTRAEAYGIVAIEAGASGLPIIMTDVGGIRDIVQDNKNGYLIEVDNVQQLSDRMTRLMKDPELRWQMGQNARKRVEDNFTAKNNATRIVDVLLEVAANHQVR